MGLQKLEDVIDLAPSSLPERIRVILHPPAELRSTQTTEEASDQKESQATAAVSAASNLPTERDGGGPAAASSEQTKQTEETVNYEISRTVRNQTKRGATLRKLSIAVQVDGIYREQPDGSRAYEPRGAEELTQLGDAGAQRGRHRREPRRRGRGGEPASSHSPAPPRAESEPTAGRPCCPSASRPCRRSRRVQRR